MEVGMVVVFMGSSVSTATCTAGPVAAREGHFDTAMLLLQLRADIDAQDDNGLTALTTAERGMKQKQRTDAMQKATVRHLKMFRPSL